LEIVGWYGLDEAAAQMSPSPLAADIEESIDGWWFRTDEVMSLQLLLLHYKSSVRVKLQLSLPAGT